MFCDIVVEVAALPGRDLVPRSHLLQSNACFAALRILTTSSDIGDRHCWFRHPLSSRQQSTGAYRDSHNEYSQSDQAEGQPNDRVRSEVTAIVFGLHRCA